jgi:hypothetical protein
LCWTSWVAFPLVSRSKLMIVSGKFKLLTALSKFLPMRFKIQNFKVLLKCEGTHIGSKKCYLTLSTTIATQVKFIIFQKSLKKYLS